MGWRWSLSARTPHILAFTILCGTTQTFPWAVSSDNSQLQIVASVFASWWWHDFLRAESARVPQMLSLKICFRLILAYAKAESASWLSAVCRCRHCQEPSQLFQTPICFERADDHVIQTCIFWASIYSHKLWIKSLCLWKHSRGQSLLAGSKSGLHSMWETDLTLHRQVGWSGLWYKLSRLNVQADIARESSFHRQG